MELTMSMFSTQADYWKTRAELAETVVAEVAHELGCENDNEAILTAIDALKPQPEPTIGAKCQRIEGSGEICGLTPPCPDCGSSLIDVADGSL